MIWPLSIALKAGIKLGTKFPRRYSHSIPERDPKTVVASVATHGGDGFQLMAGMNQRIFGAFDPHLAQDTPRALSRICLKYFMQSVPG
jgi:hypothetical protein